MTSDRITTRFAPTPSGRMHAGNIYSYLISWLCARKDGGSIICRVEDIDSKRSKESFSKALLGDLELLGFDWDSEVVFQSRRKKAYEEHIEILDRYGLLYECFCSRADLSASAPHAGDARIYNRHCLNLSKDEKDALKDRFSASGRHPSLRVKVPDRCFGFDDLVCGSIERNIEDTIGDFIVRRSDGDYAYQLAVVVDDAASGINLVVRGNDLLDPTIAQLYLQDVFNFGNIRYAHIPLIKNAQGQRLAKRDRSASIEELLKVYKTPYSLLGHIAYITELIDLDESISLTELLQDFEMGGYFKKISNVRSFLFR